MTLFPPMVTATCLHCDDFPCHCPAPVTVRCVCGGYLTASDTLEDKGRVHTAHVGTVTHEAWRAHQRLRVVA